MKPKTNKTLNLTKEPRCHVLIAEGGSANTVSDALERRDELIHDLRQRLAALEHGAVSAIEKAGRRVTRKAARQVKRRMSPRRRAALKLHGRYLGHIRTLPKVARAKIKVIREAKGVHAAIRAARTIAKPAAPAGAQRAGARSTQPDYQSSQQRKLARYQRERSPNRTSTEVQGRGGSRADRVRVASTVKGHGRCVRAMSTPGVHGARWTERPTLPSH